MTIDIIKNIIYLYFAGANILLYFFQDKYIFPAFQIFLLVLFLFALVKEKFSRDMAVKRGQEAQNFLYIAYGIISFDITQIISNSEAGKDYKVLLTIIDLLLILHLCFYNSWSRNKLIGFYVKFKNKVERL
jgi:hypothetical protein